MSDERRIAQLEALLARIRSRSRPPRASPYASRATAPEPRPRRVNPLEVPTPHAAFRPGPLPAAPSAQTFASPSPPARPKHTPRPEVPVGLLARGTVEPPFVQPDAQVAQGMTWSPAVEPPPREIVEAPAKANAAPPPTELHAPPPTELHAPPPMELHAPPPMEIHAPPPMEIYEPPPMEVVELEVDPDPSIPPPPLSGPSLEDTSPEGASGARPAEEALESRSRLVSAPPSPVLGTFDAIESLDGGEEPVGLSPSDPTIEVAAAEVSRAELDALEEDSAPSSSRRPISLEAKMSEPDDDVPPLHAPPPESGPLLAALPTFELAFEPEPETGVTRTDPAASATRSETRDLSEVSVIRAEPLEAEVAVFVTTPRRDPGAKTFGELLDDALSL